METQENNRDPNEESLASDGPISKNEGDGGADLNDTDDLEIVPNDDIDTNVDQDDLDALEGMDYDDEDL